MATKVSKKAINKYNSSVTYQSGRVGNVRYVEKGGETDAERDITVSETKSITANFVED